MRRHSIRMGVLVIVLAVLAGVAAPQVTASPRFAEWSDPEWLGATINSAAGDFGPGISKNGLALYFTSTRSGGGGGEDIWVSYRTTDTAWGTPLNLTPVNSAVNDRVPSFSNDGHWMFFARGTPPDIWISYRQHTHEDFGPFGWQTPTPLPSTGVNTASADVAPSYFRDDESGTTSLFFASNRPGGSGDFDIYVAVQQPDGSFGAVSPVTGLNTPLQEARPSIRHDGLEIFFHRATSPANTSFELWSATRESVGSPWNEPTRLDLGDGAQPAISWDGRTLYFASVRTGGAGTVDLWMSTRGRETGKP